MVPQEKRVASLGTLRTPNRYGERLDLHCVDTSVSTFQATWIVYGFLAIFSMLFSDKGMKGSLSAKCSGGSLAPFSSLMLHPINSRLSLKA